MINIYLYLVPVPAMTLKLYRSIYIYLTKSDAEQKETNLQTNIMQTEYNAE